METVFFQRKWVCALIVIVCVSFFSCDNKQETEQSAVEVITGNYKGVISFDKFTLYDDTETLLKSNIEARLNNNMIAITDFPVYTILAVLEDDKTARSISEQMDVEYSIDYSTLVIDANRIRLILDPDPLTFTYKSGNEQEINDVEIFFGTGIKTSAYVSEKLQLKIILEEIRVNGKPLFIIDEQYITIQLYKVN